MSDQTLGLGIERVDLRVDCYAGRKADEGPIRFWLHAKPYRVEAVLDQWYDPESIFYKVRADDGDLYILRQSTSTPDRAWDLVSFRRTGEWGRTRRPAPASVTGSV